MLLRPAFLPVALTALRTIAFLAPSGLRRRRSLRLVDLWLRRGGFRGHYGLVVFFVIVCQISLTPRPSFAENGTGSPERISLFMEAIPR